MENAKKYRFYLIQSMKLIKELREHVTCSLPCIYCAKYDINTICDGRFEWLYEEAIGELLNEPEFLCSLSEEQLRQLKEIVGEE